MNVSLNYTIRRLLPLLLLLVSLSVAAQKGEGCPPGSKQVSSVFQAGEQDSYRLPTEPAIPGQDLLQFSQKWRDFDDMSSGSSFGHTFTNLPCMIVDARLVIRLTPGRNGFDDLIGLEGRGEGSFAWSGYLAELVPGWEPNRPFQLTLDLLNLPGPKGSYNLLEEIARDGGLDVFIGDDTAVDDMTLYITWCEFTDCNNNCIPDEEDIATGFSKDANRNGIPDECEEPQQDPIQILCERYRLIAAGNNCCGWVILAPSVSGVTGDYTITNDFDPSQGGYLEYCFPMGVTTIRFTLTDLSTGQTVSCLVTVHVVDNNPPVITPKED